MKKSSLQKEYLEVIEYFKTDDNKYYCYPDFLYNNMLIEIKGPQFVKADGT